MNEFYKGDLQMKGSIHIDYHKHTGSFPKKLLYSLKNMPIPQGVIVMVALGITIGTAMADGLDIISKISEILSIISSFVLGLVSLWMLNIPAIAPTHEISNHKGIFVRILNYAIICIMVINLFQIFDYPDSSSIVIFNVATIFFMLFVFLVSLQIFVDKKK
jgi:hypothetical protein